MASRRLSRLRKGCAAACAKLAGHRQAMESIDLLMSGEGAVGSPGTFFAVGMSVVMIPLSTGLYFSRRAN